MHNIVNSTHAIVSSAYAIVKELRESAMNGARQG